MEGEDKMEGQSGGSIKPASQRRVSRFLNIVGKFLSSMLWEQRWDPNGEEKFWAALTPPGVPQGWMGYGGPKPKNFFGNFNFLFQTAAAHESS